MPYKDQKKNKKVIKEWHDNNKDKMRAYRKKYRQKKRQQFIDLYGGKCTHCGEDRDTLLTIDHIHNDGHLTRKNNATGARTNRDNLGVYLDAIKNYDSTYYQVLCMNCNCHKAWYGRLPNEFSDDNFILGALSCGC